MPARRLFGAPSLRRCLLPISLLLACGVAAHFASGAETEISPPGKDSRPRAVSQVAASQVAEESRPKQTGAVISEAHYTVVVEGRVARIDCRLVVQLIGRQRARLPLNFGEMAVGVLKSKNTSAFLRGVGHGKFVLTVEGEGKQEVSLPLMANVNATDAGDSFKLFGPPAGITTLDVKVPREKQTVAVSPGLIAETVQPEAGFSRVKGRLPSTGDITVAWHDAATATKPLKPILTAKNYTQIQIREQRIDRTTQLVYQIVRGEVTELQFAMPADHKLLDVSSPDNLVRDRKSETKDGEQHVTVFLTKPVRNTMDLRIYTQQPIGEKTVPLAGHNDDGAAIGVHGSGVLRESVFLAVMNPPEIDLRVASAEGWSPASPAEAPQWMQLSKAVCYRSFRPSTSLSAVVQPATPRVSVHQDAVVSYGTDHIALQANLNYDVERVGVSELRIGLPPGFQVKRVTGDADTLKSHDVSSDDAKPTLHIVLAEKRTGSINIRVEADRQWTAPWEAAQQTIPLCKPQGVHSESGRIQVHAARPLDVYPDEKTGRSSLRVTPTKESADQTFAWSYLRSQPGIGVVVRRQQSRITASVDRTIGLGHDGFHVTSRWNLEAHGVPQKTVTLSVPAAILASLQIHDDAGNPLTITQTQTDDTSKQPPAKQAKDDAGRSADRIVHVALTTPMSGKTVLTVTYPVAHDAGQATGDETVEASVPLLTLLAPNGQPVDLKSSTLSINSGKPFLVTTSDENVDPSAKPASSSGNTYHLKGQPRQLALRVQPLTIQPVAQLVVARCLAEVAVGADATGNYRCRYAMLDRGQKSIRVHLPQTVEPLAVTINGQAAALTRLPGAKPAEGWSAFSIDVARDTTELSDVSLVIQYRMPLTPAPFEWSMGRLRLHLPRLFDVGGKAAVIQEQRNAVWMPRRFSLVGESPGVTRKTLTRLSGFAPRDLTGEKETTGLENWIGVSPADVAFPVSGHAYRFRGIPHDEQIEVSYIDIWFATWALSIPMFFIGLILLRTTWQNRLSITLLISFAAALAAVYWHDEVYHGLLAARYGLAAVIAWWLTHDLLAVYRNRRNSDSESAPCGLPLNGLSAVVIPPPGTFAKRPPVYDRSKAA